MPSMHVALAVLNAIFASSLNRWAGILAWARAAAIMFGSVYFGWHYALDGYVSIAAVIIIWRIFSKPDENTSHPPKLDCKAMPLRAAAPAPLLGSGPPPFFRPPVPGTQTSWGSACLFSGADPQQLITTPGGWIAREAAPPPPAREGGGPSPPSLPVPAPDRNRGGRGHLGLGAWPVLSSVEAVPPNHHTYNY